MVKVKIHRSKDGQFYFTFVKNQVSVTSETYTRKANAIKSAMGLAEGLRNWWHLYEEGDAEIIDTTKD
jgi:uncharacterized protein YegP (UPF0339 family)